MIKLVELNNLFSGHAPQGAKGKKNNFILLLLSINLLYFLIRFDQNYTFRLAINSRQAN